MDIGSHARHPQRTDRFNARLLHRIEDQPRFSALRRHHRMGIRIVAGETQRHGIAEAAGNGNFLRGGFLGNFRQAHALAGKTRPFIGENDFDFGIASDGSHASGNRLTQRFRIDRRTRFRSGIVAARCHCLSCRLSTPAAYASLDARSAGVLKSWMIFSGQAGNDQALRTMFAALSFSSTPKAR